MVDQYPVKGGAERLKTIKDSQRMFAARFRHAASEKCLDGTNEGRIPGSSRWAPRFDRPPRTSRGSPMAGRWSTRPPHEHSMTGRMPLTRMSCEPIRSHVVRVDVPLDSSSEASDGNGRPQNVGSSRKEGNGGEGKGQKPLAMIVDYGDSDRKGVEGEVGEEQRKDQGKGGDPEDPEGGACNNPEAGEGEREGSSGGTDTCNGGENQDEGREKAKEVSQRGKGSGGSKHTVSCERRVR